LVRSAAAAMNTSGQAMRLVSAGVMLAEPHLVVAEPVQRHRPFEVVFQCDGRGLADRVKRRYEHPEVEWLAHIASDSAKNSRIAALTSSGRSC